MLKSIRVKILIPMIALALCAAAAILITNIILFSGFVDRATVEKVDSSARVALTTIDSLELRATTASHNFAKDPGIIQAIVAEDQEALFSQAFLLLEETDADFCTITDAEGIVIARTHNPEQRGDSALAQANIQSALHGKPLTVIEEGSVVRLSIRAGTPVLNEQNEIVGVISVGCRLDTEEFVTSIKDVMGCETTVVLGDERIATTVQGEDGDLVVGTKADPDIVDAVSTGASYSGRVDIVGRLAVCKYSPLYGPNDQVIGMLFVGQYFEGELATIGAFLQGGLIIALITLALCVLVTLIVVRRIVTPIRSMTKAATALADGDTDLDVKVNTKDEMRTLADAFNRMTENIRQQVQTVEQIANGTLKVSPKKRSEKDIMNHSLDKLNTTLKAQAAAIKEENERVKRMLDASPLAVRLWNKDFELIECNEAALRLFGATGKREYIERYYDFAPEYQPDGQKTSEKSMGLVREAFETGSAASDWLYRKLDGTLIPAELTIVRIPYGDSYAAVGYSRDLREHQKMMDAIQKTSAQLEVALADAKNANEAKSAFLAQMSHEIRSPLNVVVGMSELILDNESLGSETQNKLENIHTSGMTILNIVNDILDISKIESGKFEILSVAYDTPSLINDIIALNMVRIEEKAISFEIFIDENLPGMLLGDDLRIKQIFNNLLSNAFKYTYEGSIAWRISFEREGEIVWLISSVRDTGVGIKPDDVKKLFSAYSQVDTGSNRHVEGTGLGLAITKRLVEMMGGSISVESEYGKGSTFHVRLQQSFLSDEPIGKTVADNLSSLRYTFSKRIGAAKLARVDLSYAQVLIVDDIATNLDVVKGMLKPYGIKIDLATNGQAAIDKIRAETPRYDAVFMDHMMPGMDGIEATRIIREEIGSDYARNLPIIALTANALTGNEELFLSKGFQAFIPKPIDIVKLDSVLRQWLRKKELENTDMLASDQGTTPLLTMMIKGIHIAKALERFGADEAIFIDVLRSYSFNTRPLLGRLKEDLAKADLKNYAIIVHGIKGSSYGISAQEIALKAEELEKAADTNNLALIQAQHPIFEKALKALLDDIDAALHEIDTHIPKALVDKPDQKLLEELRNACKAFDMDRVDEVMAQLEAFCYRSGNELLRWLRKHINAMNFEVISDGQWPSNEEAGGRKG